MNFSIPNNFGERPCDRVLIATLRSSAVVRLEALGLMLQIWRDFAIARDDRREVPLDAAARAASQAVLIIEEFAGWYKGAGRLVESGIGAGFFSLVPQEEDSAELVLVDFYPANHAAATTVNASRLGGLQKGLGIADRVARKVAGEQLEMFRLTKDPVLAAHSEVDIKAALHFVTQLCHVLRRNQPQAAEWRAELAGKAIQVLHATTVAARDNTFRWFIMNRESPEIPLRLDFILDRFDEFSAKAQSVFNHASR